jgi:hypothetical protein
MQSLEQELASVMSTLRRGREVLPFLERWCAVSAVALELLPDAMYDLLATSPDYEAIESGAGPVWLQIASGDEAAELVVYRALADGRHYIVAPSGESEGRL